MAVITEWMHGQAAPPEIPPSTPTKHTHTHTHTDFNLPLHAEPPSGRSGHGAGGGASHREESHSSGVLQDLVCPLMWWRADGPADLEQVLGTR